MKADLFPGFWRATHCEPREIGKNPPSISISVEKAYAGLIFGLLDTYRLAHERFTIVPTFEALQALNDHHDAIVKKAVANYGTLAATLRAGMSKPGALRFACMPVRTAAKRTGNRSLVRLRSAPLRWQTGLLLSNCEF